MDPTNSPTTTERRYVAISRLTICGKLSSFSLMYSTHDPRPSLRLATASLVSRVAISENQVLPDRPALRARMELAKVVAPTHSKQKWMLMLAAYVDESGHSKDPKCRFVGLAGFVATAAQWDIFQLQWKAALDEFNDGEEFHAKEFYRRSPQSKYANWPQEKKDGFIARLTGSLEAAQAKAVGCIVSLDHYEQLEESFRRATVDPYYMAFQEVTKGLALSGSPIMNDDLKVDPVSMVYAYQKEYGATDAGRAMQLWNIIKSHPDKFIWAEWMGTYTSAFPCETLPLQAADLFAYELTREFEQWAKPSPAAMRKALKAIIRSQGNLLIKLYDRSAMLDMLWNSGGFSDATTEESPIALEAYTTMRVVRDTLVLRANE